MRTLNTWTKASNYVGQDFSEYYIGPSRSRDSELIAESNFECALELLGGESDSVLVSRCSHWACGWVEQILVLKSCQKSVKILSGIADSLESYPILNDDDFYERENEQLESDFENYSSEFTRNAIKDLNASTDVPLEILESLESSKAFSILLREIHRESASYHGNENAFIKVGDFTRFFKNIDCDNWASSDVRSLNTQIRKAIGA